MRALGGFKLTKFVSNVLSIPNEVEPNSDNRTAEAKEMPTAEKFSHVLGLKWNHSTDTLVVRETSPNTDRNVTQRVVLSLVSAVYDPIGLVAPFTITARILLKYIWRLCGQQWDDDVPDEIVMKFLDWSKELSTLNEISIPRNYFCQTVETIELHVFGDSSQDAFSAVTFLRGNLINNYGVVTQLAFVFGKEARVAPTKALTVSKLELQDVLLAVRLRDEVIRALSLVIDRTFMWSDSSTVLQWLISLEKQPTIVANRVCEILELTTVDERHYVPTAHNTADAGTRGLSASALLNSCWLTGPDFLKTSDFPFKPPDEFCQKVKFNRGADSTEVNETKEHQCTTISETVTKITTTFEWQKYSSYEKLLRIVAYMLRLLP